MSNVLRIQLSPELEQTIATEPDPAKAFALLNAAADFTVREDRPMPLDEALRTLHQIAEQIEGLG